VRILNAALELMSEKGYSATSISMICRRSGLPPSSTYWHFGSKEGLLSAVVDHGARKWMEALPRWSELEGDPRDRFRALLQGAADSMTRDSNPMRLIMMLSLERRSSMDPESAEVIRSVRRSAAGGFRLAFREIYGIETPEARRHSEELAEFGLALADGALIAHQVDASTDMRRLFDFVAEAFLAIGDRLAAEAELDVTDRPVARDRALVGDRG
jgi:AcrR family transcriptional regulator